MENDGESDAFPEANVSGEMNLSVPENFPADPVSSDWPTPKELKEQTEARANAKARAEAKDHDKKVHRAKSKAKEEADKNDIGYTLVSALLISGAVAAAIGVAFILTKKLREK